LANKELKKATSGFQWFDRELLSSKVGRKAFTCAAYAMGVALGFSILVLLLPDPEGVAQAERVIKIFHAFSLSLLVYAAIAVFGMMFMKAQLKYVMILLNWVAFPTVAYVFVQDLYYMMVGP
jgi:hypothetical protein